MPVMSTFSHIHASFHQKLPRRKQNYAEIETNGLNWNENIILTSF